MTSIDNDVTTHHHIVGIDYSITCPAITFMDSGQNFEDCRIFYHSDKVPVTTLSNVVGTRIEKYTCDQQRYDMISSWAMDVISMVGTDSPIWIEDYSFGSKGKIFNLAENTGLLKFRLWRAGYNFRLVSPCAIKKFATGQGNASKRQMHEAFRADTGIDLMPIYQPTAKEIGSPTGDIVDSYFIARYGFSHR